MSEEGAPTYLPACPENDCPVTFIGARPTEVLDHIYERHGEALAFYYQDSHGAFEEVPDEYVAGLVENDE